MALGGYDAELRRYDEVLRSGWISPRRPSSMPASLLAARGPADRDRDVETAGFAGIAFTEVNEPVYYGPDVDAAMDWVRGFTCTSEVLKRLDPAAATRALARLRKAVAAHLTDDGVWFDSRAWIITGRLTPPM